RTLPDDLLHLLADTLQRDTQALQRLRGHTLTLMDQAKQNMLRADVVVVEHPSLFLGQDDNPPCSVGEPLEHSCAPHVPVGTALASRAATGPTPSRGRAHTRQPEWVSVSSLY